MTPIEVVDPEAIQKLVEAAGGGADLGEAGDLLDELHGVLSRNQLAAYYSDTAANGHPGGPYPWQVEWHAMGATARERAIMAANQVGKSRTAAAEFAMHVTGLYPAWWVGFRFKGAINAICAAPTNELLRDTVQVMLCGKMVEGEREPDGTGWIPRGQIVAWTFRQCGVPNVIDTVTVRHASGAASTIKCKSYEQTYVKFQGTTENLVWLDEEPDDGMMIYTECQMRLVAKSGLLMFTRTPLFGATEIIQRFQRGGPGIWMKNVTWEDAPHLSNETKAQLIATFPPHQLAARTQGIPMMGSGAVYPIDFNLVMIDPIEIPRHWRRINGCDFGIDHPGAGCFGAWDPDTDVAYVYDCYKIAGQTAPYHADALNARGRWIPVAWPHDGLVREKGKGETLADQYRDAGANMLPESARIKSEVGGAQPRDSFSSEVLTRMMTGRLKIFKTCGALLEELRMLHREKGVIVPVNDDIESAMRYMLMDLRHAEYPPDSDRASGRPKVIDVSEYDPLGRSL